MFELRPERPLPLFPPAEVAAYSNSVKPKGAGVPTAAALAGLITSTDAASRMASAGATTITTAMRISAGPSFFPRYSGERPIIKLATNTASTAKPSRPTNPVPTPPPTTSPSPMSASGTSVPIGVMASIDALAEPLEVALVSAVHAADSPTPIRHSFPSILPAD